MRKRRQGKEVRKVKTKPIKESLREKAEEAMKLLEERRKEFLSEIALLHERVDDVERKIRWLKREILDEEK
jgi:hypothetical protein